MPVLTRSEAIEILKCCDESFAVLHAKLIGPADALRTRNVKLADINGPGRLRVGASLDHRNISIAPGEQHQGPAAGAFDRIERGYRNIIDQAAVERRSAVH